jgi:hypothetical protein
MNRHVMARILAILERAPIWIRHDLNMKDDTARRRAEETLAAMIAASLEAQRGED